MTWPSPINTNDRLFCFANDVQIAYFNNTGSVELTVTQTDPGVRGDTASGGGNKPATLESGVIVQVPLFVNTGDFISASRLASGCLMRWRAGGGPPFGERDHSRWYERQAAEQGAHLGMAARDQWGGDQGGVGADRGSHRAGREVGGQVRDSQIAARCQLAGQRGDDPGRVVGVGDEMQHRQQQHRRGPIEIQCP